MAAILRWLAHPAAKFGLGVSSRRTGSGGVVGGTDSLLIGGTDVLLINATDSTLI